MADANIQLGYKTAAWFAANPTLILLAGQMVYKEQTGEYKIGDGTTQLSSLSFLGESSSASWGGITGTLSNQTDLQNALNGKEVTITAGTTSQYYRGDKTFQTLDKNTIGLGNVNNTSDANKPVSTAQQTALNAKQDSLIIYSSAVDSTPTSGTSNTLCTGVLISANTYSNGKRLRALVRVRKNNTVGTVTLRVYVNSTNDLSGATLLGTYAGTAAHQLIGTVFNYPFKSSTTVERFNATFSVVTDEHAGGISLAPVTFTFDSTANRYLIFALQNSSASDTSYISYLTVEKL